MQSGQEEQLITLLFHQAAIADVFADLLEAMGYDTALADSKEEISLRSKIITEPLYYDELSNEQKEQSLVICDDEDRQKITGLCISRPLTSEKVEQGLRDFLDLQPLH